MTFKTVSRSLWLYLILLLLAGPSLYAQGQFAGAKPRALIGKKYNNDRILPGLPGYEYREVTLASGDKDPEQFTVGLFQKGSTWLVFFGLNEDSTTDHYTILDVLIIKHVTKNQAVKALLCRQEKISNIEIIALTQPGNAEYSPALKAWRFNRDKRRFELMNTRGVDCLNEGQD